MGIDVSIYFNKKDLKNADYNTFQSCIELFIKIWARRWSWLRDDFGFDYGAKSKDILTKLENRRFAEFKKGKWQGNQSNEDVRLLFIRVCPSVRIVLMSDYDRYRNTNYIEGFDLMLGFYTHFAKS